jgi:signal transduction histidine kinase
MLASAYRVLVANSGQRALELAIQEPRPSLILLDIMMPDMDGYEVLSRLRSLPSAHDIPVIFLTALSALEDEVKGLQLGAVDYVTKPVQAAILMARVRTQIELDRMRRALVRQNEELEWRVAERTQELRLALHAAEAASVAKGEFLANIGHELRTPMNGIVGALTLLMSDDGLNDEQRELAVIVKDSADCLKRLLNELFDYAAADAGKRRIGCLPFRAEFLIERLREQFAPRAAGKGLRFDLRLDAALPPVLLGDTDAVQQLLGKLLDNAVKFTASGSVSLDIRAVEALTDRATLRFEVQDTGIGVPADKAELIFQPFTQADGSITRQHGGSGLGLAMAQRLATLMNGQIGYRPGEGGGSVFWIELPFGVPAGD